MTELIHDDNTGVKIGGSGLKFYHGTSWYQALKIIKDGRVRRTTKELSIYKDVSGKYSTTPGYVYLTGSDDQAFRWGKNALFDARSTSNFDELVVSLNLSEAQRLAIYIFEVDIIDNNILEPDLDECRIRSSPERAFKRIERCNFCNTNNCIEKIASVRCTRDIVIGIDVKRYKIMSTKTKDNQFMLLQDWADIL